MLKLGWLSPQGLFIPCENYEHISKAAEICDKYGYYYHDIYGTAPDDVLIDNGWVHITVSVFTHKYKAYWSLRKRLTNAQKQFLLPYLENMEQVHIDHFNLD